MHPDKVEEWVEDIQLILDYEPEATVWDLFKFEYMKLHGVMPANVEIDYPGENILKELSAAGYSPTDIAALLKKPRWLVLEALEFFEIPFCVVTINAGGIAEAFRSGITDKKLLAKKFDTTIYYVNKALKMNGEADE